MDMDKEKLREIYVREAVRHDKKSDKEIWLSAVFCEPVVGKYDRGATLGLADDMSRSPDTIEDRAHGYAIFKKLCKLDGGKYRQFVFLARRAPYIHFSHFRALHDLQVAFNLHDAQLISLLQDIVMAEGGLSSRGLDAHVREKFGDTRDWTYYAARALKELNKTEGQPDLPNTPEVIGIVHSITFDVKDGPVTYFVVAYNSIRAEAVARKQLARDHGRVVAEKSKCIGRNEIEKVFSDSKHILNVTSSWLGDNS